MRVTGEPDGERGGEEAGERSEDATGPRWSWSFWCTFAAAAAPAAVSLLVTLGTYQDDDLVHQYTSTPDPTTALEFGDRWAVVLRLDQPGWSSILTALATLVLAAVVVTGRPAWLQVPSGRVAVVGLGVAGAAWALVPVLVTCAYLLSDPTTAEEAARAQWGDQRTRFSEWAPAGGQSLLAAAVSTVAAWWCGWRGAWRSHEGVGEDPVEGAPAQ